MHLCLCAIMLCCLGSGSVVTGEGMKATQSFRSKFQKFKPRQDNLRRPHSPNSYAPYMGYMEVLEVRGIFKTRNSPDSTIDEFTLMIQKHPGNQRKKPEGGVRRPQKIEQMNLDRKNNKKLVLRKRKQKETLTKRNMGPFITRMKPTFSKRLFKKARKAKTPRKPELTISREIYDEVKRKAPWLRKLEPIRGSVRNKNEVRTSQAMDKKEISSRRAVRTGSSVVSLNEHQAQPYGTDGDVEQNEVTAKKARKAKTPRKPELTISREIYDEVKRKAPWLRKLEPIRGSVRNKNEVRTSQAMDKKEISSRRAMRTGSSVVSSNEHQAQPYGTDGDVEENEVTAINNGLDIPHISVDHHETRQRQHQGDEELLPTVVATTGYDLSVTEPVTHATTARSDLFSQQETTVMYEEPDITKNDSDFLSTSVSVAKPFQGTQDKMMSDKITHLVNSIREHDKTLEVWNNKSSEDIPTSTVTSSEPARLTQPPFQPDEDDIDIDDNEIDTFISQNMESSGESEIQAEQVYQNQSLQMTPPSEIVRHPPSGQNDSEILNITLAHTREGVHDKVYSPLETSLSRGAKSASCQPGYKRYGDTCKSLCDLGDLYCENGGRCVIVENLGAMCRCHQTNKLCYSGDCCRFSFTPFQLACVIGSCCIFVLVFLGSLCLLSRRMEMKPVSKSIRTRLWISSLMPDSRSSSSSQSVQSDITDYSDWDSPSDFPSFNSNKEVTHEKGEAWNCERTRL